MAVPYEVVTNATTSARVFVNGLVNGVQLSMLVDTGAGRTLISADKFEKVCGHSNLRPSSVRLTLPGGSPMPVMGESRLRIRLSSESFSFDVLVVDGLQYDALMGADFICSYGFVVDLRRKSLYSDHALCSTQTICFESARLVNDPLTTALCSKVFLGFVVDLRCKSLYCEERNVNVPLM